MTGIWIGAAVIAGVALGWSLVAAVVAAGALLWYTRQWSGALAVAVVFLAGIGALRGAELGSEARAFPPGQIVAVRGEVERVAATRATSQSFVLDVDDVQIDGQWQPWSLRLWLTGAVLREVGRNDRVFVAGSFEPRSQIEPGFADYLAADQIDGAGYARRLEIDVRGGGWRRAVDDLAGTIRDRLQTAVPGDRGILLSGFVMGDDARLSLDRQMHFVATGTTHLTAVSGANIALLVFVVATAGRRLGVYQRSPWLITIAVTIWAYAVLVGLAAPVVRAAIVATFAVFAVWVGRRPDFVTLIALTAAVQAIVRPNDVDRIAYQLSVASSIALVLALAGDPPSRVIGWVRSAVLAVCAAQVATILFLVPTFETISWVSIPANLMVAPLASAAFALAMVASVFFVVSDTIGTAVADVAGICSAAVVAVVDFWGASPGAERQTGDVGLAARVMIGIVSIGALAMMSVECRRAVCRWWQIAMANQESVAVTSAAAMVGAVLGWMVAGLI